MTDMKSLGKRKGISPVLTLRMPDDLLKTLREMAEKDRRSLSDYVRIVLEDHVQAKGKKRGK